MIKYSYFWIFLVFGFFSSFARAESVQDVAVLRQVVDTLDVTSFSNSISPRREAGKITFKDYGFSSVKFSSGRAIVSESGNSWQFVITLLDATADKIKICLEDKALSGGNYHAQNAYLLTANKSGLLKASIARNNSCPEFAR